ncbi:MAG: HD domain-containing protein [Cytophagales bacterium]
MKKKVINDPVYGFVKLQGDLIFKVIEHPYFQRLRRIKQLGVSDYVYPGANHTRFHHALGASHLMKNTLDSLREKGHQISKNEYEATILAILLHDIGHGPLSHALEYSLLSNIKHENISSLLISKLNEEFEGALETTIQIFNNTYPKFYLHQLVSSQLDIDRLDYLNRDSFFTGVTEGTVGAERIIKMFDVVDNQLVVEEKGIYSVENFLNSRRLMYWQVYFHKTSISVETMIVQLIKRAKYLLVHTEKPVFLTTHLHSFFKNDIDFEKFSNDDKLIESFTQLDDVDIWSCIKEWQNSEDFILSKLSKSILQRNLFKTLIFSQKPEYEFIENIKKGIVEKYSVSLEDLEYLFTFNVISNEAYVANKNNIMIHTKSNELKDISDASDLPNIKSISQVVNKYVISYLK